MYGVTWLLLLSKVLLCNSPLLYFWELCSMPIFGLHCVYAGTLGFILIYVLYSFQHAVVVTIWIWILVLDCFCFILELIWRWGALLYIASASKAVYLSFRLNSRNIKIIWNVFCFFSFVPNVILLWLVAAMSWMLNFLNMLRKLIQKDSVQFIAQLEKMSKKKGPTLNLQPWYLLLNIAPKISGMFNWNGLTDVLGHFVYSV